jgi:hypothetical protein
MTVKISMTHFLTLFRVVEGVYESFGNEIFKEYCGGLTADEVKNALASIREIFNNHQVKLNLD